MKIIEQLDQGLDWAMKRIARLEADLEECREYIEGYSDISNETNDDASPRPNRAMQLCSMIDETLNGRRF